MDYIAYVHKDRKSDFGVSFPDFPGCVTAGRTREEVWRKAPEALALHIEGMIEDGEPIPKPSKIDEIKDDPDRKGAIAIWVSDAGVKANLEQIVRVNITARKKQIATIDRLANEAGMTRSAYMVWSAIKEENHIADIRGGRAASAGSSTGRDQTENKVSAMKKRLSSKHRSASH